MIVTGLYTLCVITDVTRSAKIAGKTDIKYLYFYFYFIRVNVILGDQKKKGRFFAKFTCLLYV